MNVLKLPEDPTLQDYQRYITEMMKARGFDKNSIVEEMLLLTEEVGELAKVVRKAHGMHMDKNSVQSSAAEELADVFSFVLSISNI
ncbi:MAG: MazG nucleotide pyrophosphohydrolase domain-containing protein [Candidatus Saccharibacteria bacterium]|nr:MazG nucleotide pyrophosphohydrolase domain-containing protein [Candidatus Saccharibacteria bacterium]